MRNCIKLVIQCCENVLFVCNKFFYYAIKESALCDSPWFLSRHLFLSSFQVERIARKNRIGLVFWIRFSYSGIVNYSEMPIPNAT